MMPYTGRISTLLPAIAARRLADAAKIEEEHKRRRAVDKAILFAQVNYPQFFKDNDHETANQ
jgi:hypothetical protein